MSHGIRRRARRTARLRIGGMDTVDTVHLPLQPDPTASGLGAVWVGDEWLAGGLACSGRAVCRRTSVAGVPRLREGLPDPAPPSPANPNLKYPL
jgi:hypothetical protein